MKDNQYSQEELNKLHQVEFEILEEIIRICKENKITYFAHCGTILGAVRHRGIIPWDDDIDVAMLRDDYDRFLETASKALKPEFFLQHFSTDSNTSVYFIKIRKNGTVFMEQGFKHVQTHNGIFVDVFPFDYVPEDERKLKQYKLKTKLLLECYKYKVYWTAPMYKGFKLKYLLGNIARVVLHILLLPVNRRVLYDKLDREMRKYNHTGTKWVTSKLISHVSVEDIIPVRRCKFDSIEIDIPNNSEKLLTCLYGDYMELPPIEKRKGHRPLEISFENANS